MQIKIRYLADHPEFVHHLATWLFDEWGKNNPSLTIANIERRVTERMNRDRIPLCLLGFVGSQPVGTATLKIREMEIYPQFEHWLGNVYVVPDHRRRGIGSYIVEKTVEEAKLLGVRDLYLYTSNQIYFYQRLGWGIIERIEYREHRVTVMKRELK